VRPRVVCVETWAGRREYPVEIVGETPRRYRIRAQGEMLLPRRRLCAGDVALVPKSAVRVLGLTQDRSGAQGSGEAERALEHTADDPGPQSRRRGGSAHQLHSGPPSRKDVGSELANPGASSIPEMQRTHQRAAAATTAQPGDGGY